MEVAQLAKNVPRGWLVSLASVDLGDLRLGINSLGKYDEYLPYRPTKDCSCECHVITLNRVEFEEEDEECMLDIYMECCGVNEEGCRNVSLLCCSR
jgi:hypothetical protein